MHLGAPVQIAYAVDDVSAAAYQWAQRGVGPFFVREHIAVTGSRIRGDAAPFDHSSAYGQWGEVMVELICHHNAPPSEPSSGLHHLAFFVDDFDQAADELVAAGHAEVIYAEAGGMPFALFDARAVLGHLIEIYEDQQRLQDFYAMVRNASDGWHGDDPVRMLG